MSGTDALSQIGGTAATASGAVAGAFIILKWLVPYVINLWFEKKSKIAELEAKNLALAVDLEATRKHNADLQIGRLDEIVKLHTEQITQFIRQSNRNDVKMSELETTLRHTDSQLARWIPHLAELERIIPHIDRLSVVLDQVMKRKNPPAKAAPNTDPSGVTEKVQIGPDAIMFRTKKPEG